ncbi:MAG: hypothetical protein ACI4VQ_04245 [Clostridia bacterium]
MFIRNFKVNGKLIFKIIFIILCILVLAMFLSGIYKILKNSEKVTCGLDNISRTKTNVISASNYTNVLKTVHENIDNYVGMKIKFTGFVYRLYDFTDEQFVLARQMIISSDMQAVIVGFLCHLNGANRYSDGTWVEVEGTITKGNYHGEIPVIEIDNIKHVETPNDEYVYPPSDTYVPTSSTL